MFNLSGFRGYYVLATCIFISVQIQNASQLHLHGLLVEAAVCFKAATMDTVMTFSVYNK